MSSSINCLTFAIVAEPRRVVVCQQQRQCARREDEQFLKSIFILTFEAVRGAVGVTPRITRWLAEVEAAIAAALTTGRSDGSVRADLESVTAARETVMTGIGIAYAWIVLPGTNLHAELMRWRTRIDADYSPQTSP
jgi:hypothetical protein